ncbi:hypothetical protein [Pedobacter paludis]|nr:hypothetical protein [Pedobacter paludis]
MTEIDHFSSADNICCQLICFGNTGPWQVLPEGEIIGILQKEQGQWTQVYLPEIEETLFREITLAIDRAGFNFLPKELLGRWPKQLREVIMQSDHEYLVVCKAEINFAAFSRIFSTYISGMLQDEWEICLKLFSHGFSMDKTVPAKK